MNTPTSKLHQAHKMIFGKKNTISQIVYPIDLSVSPSPRTQTSQWQSSISCTVSGNRTSLGFSSIEKHWRIWNSHWFYASKMENRCAWVLVTLIPGILSVWAISVILLHFLNPNKTEQIVPKYSTSIQMKTKKLSFSGCHTLIKLQFPSAQAER